MAKETGDTQEGTKANDKFIKAKIVFKTNVMSETYFFHQDTFRQLEADFLAYLTSPHDAAKKLGCYDARAVSSGGGGMSNERRRIIVAFNDIHHIG